MYPLSEADSGRRGWVHAERERRALRTCTEDQRKAVIRDIFTPRSNARLIHRISKLCPYGRVDLIFEPEYIG